MQLGPLVRFSPLAACSPGPQGASFGRFGRAGAWCLAPSNDSAANHRHVGSCRAKPQGADALYPGHHYAAFQTERRRKVVRVGVCVLG